MKLPNFHSLDKNKIHQLSVVLLLALIAYSLFNLWQNFEAVTPKEKTSTSTIKTLPAIANFHLFGVASGDELPIAVLNTSLQGIFYSTDPQHARILAAADGGKAAVYKINDSLPEGVTIKMIKPDEVIIDQNGQLQRWLLPVPKIQFAPAADGLQQLGVQ